MKGTPSQVVGCALVDVMAAVKLQDSKAAGKRLIKVGGAAFHP